MEVDRHPRAEPAGSDTGSGSGSAAPTNAPTPTPAPTGQPRRTRRNAARPPARAGSPPPPSPGDRPSGQRRVPKGPVRRPRLIETAGPDPATPLAQVRLVVGTIIGTHGLGGEAKLRLATDDPEHLRTIKRVWVGDEARPRRLIGLRFHAGNALIRLAGVSRPEQVDALRGLDLRIAGGDARPNEEGEFFLFQLIGLRAYDEAGTELGTLSDVMETGAHDVFVIAPAEGPELLIPNHPQFVVEIRPDQGRLTVRPPIYAEPPPAPIPAAGREPGGENPPLP